MSVGDEGHYGYPHFPPNSDVGGPFTLQSMEFVPALVPCDCWAVGNFGHARYTGSMYLGAPAAEDLPPILTGEEFAAEAFSRMKPTRPKFSGLNALAELRDLPGMLRQRMAANSLGNLGSYFLAEQFGWQPLFSDIKNLVLTQIKMQKIMNQILRDNGKSVRRSVIMRDESSDNDFGPEIGSYGYTAPGLTSYWSIGQAYQVKAVSTDKIWASAEFQYFLPPGPRDIKYKRRLMLELFGLRPSPAVIYNAIPWTWLADWFSNLGSVIENLDAGFADRLAARRFYVMRKTEIGNDYRHVFNVSSSPDSYQNVELKGTATLRAVCKTRVAGNPFGFALHGINTLSAMQVAILGALGLSRL